MNSNLLTELLATLKQDAPVRDVRVGAFWTAVVVEGPQTGLRCGLASTSGEDKGEHHGTALVRQAGNLLELSALELASLAQSDSQMERSIGLAAINALLPRHEQAWVELNAEHVIAERGAGKQVAVVGHFPFVQRLQSRVGKLTVLELHPAGADDLPAECAPEIIPQADVVAITSATLLNNTFYDLITLCRPDAWVLLLGPTTPLSPLLFDYRADVISGTLVEDIDAVLRGVSQGATFRQIRGKRLVTMHRHVDKEKR
ncbi:MAG: Rossmann-like domain-containing protein [Chloroflexota bacterium]